MKLLYGAVSLLLAPLYLLTACWSAPQNSGEEIARQTGLDLSGGEEISCYDTHSGNGDGVSCIVWQFPDDQVLEQVEQDASPPTGAPWGPISPMRRERLCCPR